MSERPRGVLDVVSAMDGRDKTARPGTHVYSLGQHAGAELVHDRSGISGLHVSVVDLSGMDVVRRHVKIVVVEKDV